MKVLVADSDPLFSRLLKSKLEKWGHRVTVVYDGLEAYELIAKEPYRMVILDSPLGELPMPLRWQTGVSITGGRELWINYKSQAKTDSLRRVHFTGYLEADFVVGSR